MMTSPLTDWRRRQGLTMAAFAARIGVSKGTVSKWESGFATPRRRMLDRISAATAGEISADDLLRLHRSPEPPPPALPSGAGGDCGSAPARTGAEPVS